MLKIKEATIEVTESLDYRKLLEAHSYDRAKFKFEVQEPWYRSYLDFINIIAYDGTNMIGHACAYKCTAVIHGVKCPWYWGVDTFILRNYRGRGGAKLLQEYLHKRVPNFSSAGYVPINGIIKKKCGGKPLFNSTFAYLPVSNLFGFIFRYTYKKLFRKHLDAINIKRLPIYYWLNFSKLPSGVVLQEVDYESNQDEILEFINQTLSNQYDFYIHRDKEYMKWKYINNPNIKSHCIVYRNRGLEIESVVFFSDIYESKLSGVKIKYSKVLDVFISNTSLIKYKAIISSITNYFLKKRLRLDGLSIVSDVQYFMGVSFSREMLSTYSGPQICNPYISYMDQDLEQMI